MNLKDWEKIDEDDKSVTMQHPKGHTMTIAIKSLPKIQQEMIKRLKMAKGGKVPSNDHLDSGKDGVSEQGRIVRQKGSEAKEEAKGRAQMERTVKPKMKGLAEGGVATNEKQKSMAKEIYGKKHEASEANKDKSFFKNADIAIKGRHVKPGHYAEGTPPGGVPADDSTDQGNEQDPQVVDDQNKGHSTNIYIGTPQPVQQAQPVVVPPPVSQAPPGPAPVPKEPEPIRPVGQAGILGEAQNSLGAVNEAQNAMQKNAAIEAAQAQAEVPIQEEKVASLQQIARQRRDAYQELKQRTDQLMGAYNAGVINPNHYQESQSSGQKTATIIGLALGGFGVPFGGHNFAADHLEKQIDRDIHAQEKSFENSKTVLGAYEALYGKNNISSDLAKSSLLDIAAAKVDLIKAQLGTARAAANGDALKADLKMKAEQIRMNAAGALGGARATGQMPPAGQPPAGQAKPQDKGASNNEGHGTVRLLAPNALEMVSQAARYNPVYKDRGAELHKQLEQAQRLEAVLNGPNNDGKGGIKDLYYNMYKSVIPSEDSKKERNQKRGEHVRRTGEAALATIPYVGKAINGAIDMIPKSSAEQEYNSSSDALKTDLSTALVGLMAPTSIEELIDTNKPQYGDTPEDVARKYRFVENTIRKTGVFPDLEKLGVLRKKKSK